jgi:rhamnosyltransferase subunit B
VKPFIPFRQVLPKCKVILHHGGIGTAALAFASGTPQVVTPFAHDQFDNAARIEKTGCGVRINGVLNARKLIEALSRAATSPLIAHACIRARASVVMAPEACTAAVQYIEKFLPSSCNMLEIAAHN